MQDLETQIAGPVPTGSMDEFLVHEHDAEIRRADVDEPVKGLDNGLVFGVAVQVEIRDGVVLRGYLIHRIPLLADGLYGLIYPLSGEKQAAYHDTSWLRRRGQFEINFSADSVLAMAIAGSWMVSQEHRLVLEQSGEQVRSHAGAEMPVFVVKGAVDGKTVDTGSFKGKTFFVAFFAGETLVRRNRL